MHPCAGMQAGEGVCRHACMMFTARMHAIAGDALLAGAQHQCVELLCVELREDVHGLEELAFAQALEA